MVVRRPHKLHNAAITRYFPQPKRRLLQTVQATPRVIGVMQNMLCSVIMTSAAVSKYKKAHIRIPTISTFPKNVSGILCIAFSP